MIFSYLFIFYCNFSTYFLRILKRRGDFLTKVSAPLLRCKRFKNAFFKKTVHFSIKTQAAYKNSGNFLSVFSRSIKPSQARLRRTKRFERLLPFFKKGKSRAHAKNRRKPKTGPREKRKTAGKSQKQRFSGRKPRKRFARKTGLKKKETLRAGRRHSPAEGRTKNREKAKVTPFATAPQKQRCGHIHPFSARAV